MKLNVLLVTHTVSPAKKEQPCVHVTTCESHEGE